MSKEKKKQECRFMTKLIFFNSKIFHGLSRLESLKFFIQAKAQVRRQKLKSKPPMIKMNFQVHTYRINFKFMLKIVIKFMTKIKLMIELKHKAQINPSSTEIHTPL